MTVQGQNNILSMAKKIFDLDGKSFVLAQIYVLDIDFRGLYVVHNTYSISIQHYPSKSYSKLSQNNYGNYRKVGLKIFNQMCKVFVARTEIMGQSFFTGRTVQNVEIFILFVFFPALISR